MVKALDALALLGEHPDGVTAAQMARKTSHPFSTCYRLLNTLVSTGFARYDAQDKRYHLGLRVFQLAHTVAAPQGFESSAVPVLQRLTERTRESSVLHVPDGDRALTVRTEDGPQFRATTDPGDRAALHSTASGKILLALSEPAASEQLLLDIEFEPRTAHSLTDRDELARQVVTAREGVWTSQSEENDLGMVAITAPSWPRPGGCWVPWHLRLPCSAARRPSSRSTFPHLSTPRVSSDRSCRHGDPPLAGGADQRGDACPCRQCD